MFLILLVVLASFFATLGVIPVLINKFTEAGITGTDVNKPHKPKIPEMGGVGIVAGFVFGVLLAIAVSTLISHFHLFGLSTRLSNLSEIYAALSTILIITVIGILDDLIKIRQIIKAILPVFASFPLVAIAAGNPYLTLPLLGKLHLPFLYPLLLIPLAVTAASNLTNTLAGFNGLEAGMGIISTLSLGLIALSKGSMGAATLLFSMFGALLAFVLFNKYPARIFPGDVGTLPIGACIVSAVIIGNFETAGVIVMLPYLFDFLLKIKNQFPKELDFIEVQGERLTAKRVVGLPSLIMHITNGIRETSLVLSILFIQLAVSLLTVAIWC